MDTSRPTPQQIAQLLAPLDLHDHEDIVDRVGAMLDSAAHPATVLACAYMLERAPVRGEDGDLVWWVGPHLKELPWLQVQIEREGQRVVFATRFPLAPESLERDFFQQVWTGTNAAKHLLGLDEQDRQLAWRYMVEDAQESAKCQEDAQRIMAVDTLGLLHHATMVGDHQGSQDALLLGAPINGADKLGNRVLHVAARMKRHDFIQPLVEAGAWVDEPNQAGQTPLHLAAQHHCPPRVPPCWPWGQTREGWTRWGAHRWTRPLPTRRAKRRPRSASMSRIYDAVGLVPGTVAPSTRVRRWDHALLAGGFTFAALYPSLLGIAWLIPGGQLVRFPMALVGGLESLIYFATATISRRGPAQEFLAIAATHDQTLLRLGVCVGLAVLAAGWVFARAARPVSNTRHLSGPRLLEGKEALQECQRRTMTKKEREGDPWHLAIHPALVLPKKHWSRHTLVYGSVGAGKTQFLMPIVEQLVAKRAKAFIYDVKGDFTQRGDFGTGHLPPIIVSPFDRRSYVWDVGRDVRTPTQAAAFAASLVPEAEGSGRFWSLAAQQVLAGLLRSLQNTCGIEWGWKELADITSQPAEDMLPILQEHYPKAAALISNPEGQSAASVLASLAGYTRIIDDLATAWPKRKKRSFSITDWVRDDYTGRPQVIVQSGTDLQLTRAYIAAMINVAVPTIVSPALEDNEGGRCLAFVLDELSSIGRIALPPLIDKGRSKGVVVIAGFQDLAQSREVYGPDQAQAMASMVGTHVICKVQAGETREAVARLLGKQKVAWHNHGASAVVHFIGCSSSPVGSERLLPSGHAGQWIGR